MKLVDFINPMNWIRAFQYHRQQKAYDKSAFDLELWLYGKIMRTGMLHYGFFEDAECIPEKISIKDVEDAQVAYAKYVCDKVDPDLNKVLDVGCGMGGLSHLLMLNGHEVHALTPNEDQIKHIRLHYPNITAYHSSYEEHSSNDRYDCIVNAESIQYIDLKKAFAQSDRLLVNGGQWVITDYFRTSENGSSESGHLLDNFEQTVSDSPFRVKERHDITLNVLPTLKMISMYSNRFLMPLKHYGYEKLRYKKPWLYFLTRDIRKRMDEKILKEISSIDPEQFIKEKKYMCFVLEKAI